MSSFDLMQFRLAYRMAMADGNLTANERAILDLLQKGFDLSDEEAEELRKESDRIDFDALPGLFPDQAQRDHLLEVACLIALADGMAQPEEWSLSLEICKVLNIPRDRAITCVKQARKRLVSLVKQHDLMDELMDNLKRQGIV